MPPRFTSVAPKLLSMSRAPGNSTLLRYAAMSQTKETDLVSHAIPHHSHRTAGASQHSNHIAASGALAGGPVASTSALSRNPTGPFGGRKAAIAVGGNANGGGAGQGGTGGSGADAPLRDGLSNHEMEHQLVETVILAMMVRGAGSQRCRAPVFGMYKVLLNCSTVCRMHLQNASAACTVSAGHIVSAESYSRTVSYL